MSDERDEGADARVRRWIESEVGGTVVDLRRQPRWRPVWFVDVDRGGERLELVVRGERTDMPLIFPLDHEMHLQEVMHDHGIPTPKVYGMIDDPLAYVMDRVGGQQDFTGTSDEDRRSAVDDYLQILARLHTLPLEPFVEAGIMRAATPGGVGHVRAVAVRSRLSIDQERRPTPSWSSASAGCTGTRPTRRAARPPSPGTRASSTRPTVGSWPCSTWRSATSATR